MLGIVLQIRLILDRPSCDEPGDDHLPFLGLDDTHGRSPASPPPAIPPLSLSEDLRVGVSVYNY